MSDSLGRLPNLKLTTLPGHAGGNAHGQPAVQSVQSQLSADSGLGQALLSTLDQIVARVLGQQPVDSKGKPAGTTVYLQYQTGQGIDPRQYSNPWTPMGGSSLQDVLQSGQMNQATAAPVSGSATPTVNTALQESMMAAWQTSDLVDSMFLVDSHGALQVYSGQGRSLSFAYHEIVKAMQPANPTQQSAQVQAEVLAAQKVLYQTDSKGNPNGVPTPLYQAYLTNQMAWLQAKANMAEAQAAALEDPALGQVWPQMSATYQGAVDQAYHNWINEGAETVEQNQAIIGSQGVDAVASMVADAKELYDQWSLSGLSGLASETQYSMVSPITWYDPTDENIGFTQLKVSSQAAAKTATSTTDSFAHNWYSGQSSSTSGSVDANFFCVSLGASAGATDASDANAQGSSSVSTATAADQTSQVSIELEWLLCQVQRPWLVGDLFHLGGWYMVGQKKDTISDGTIAGQIDNTTQLLPMIPTGFLVVRNVKITANNWGEAANLLQTASTAAQGSDQSSSYNVGGSVGFFGIGASAAHAQAQDSGQASSGSSGALGWSWSGDSQQGTLTINGAQILGWVGSIVPATPVTDDPTLANSSTGSSTSGNGTGAQSQAAGSGSGTDPGSPPPASKPPAGLGGAGSNPVPPLGGPSGS